MSFSLASVLSTYTQGHPVGGSRREGGNLHHPLQESHTESGHVNLTAAVPMEYG